MKTPKEVIQQVLDHIAQHGRSIVNGVCRYRQDNTANCQIRCAIGIFISDEKYSKKMEYRTASVILQDHPDCLSPDVADIPRGLWIGLQNLHDPNYLWNLDNKTLNASGIDELSSLCYTFSVPFEELTIPKPPTP